MRVTPSVATRITARVATIVTPVRRVRTAPAAAVRTAAGLLVSTATGLAVRAAPSPRVKAIGLLPGLAPVVVVGVRVAAETRLPTLPALLIEGAAPWGGVIAAIFVVIAAIVACHRRQPRGTRPNWGAQHRLTGKGAFR